MANVRGGGLGGPRAGMTDEDRREEAQTMLRMRRAGATYASIAKQVGLSTETVHSKIKKALAEIPKEDADFIRSMEVQKLDYAELQLREKIKDGDVQAINALIRLSESRRKLLGLDMPEQHEVKIGTEEASLAAQLVKAVQEKVDREKAENGNHAG